MSNNRIPSVLILLSTFNGEKYLIEQLTSIYNQTHGSINILVRDDGSTDNTINILKTEEDHGRLIVLKNRDNVGVVNSFFRLLSEAKNIDYDFLSFSDQDDVWYSNKIQYAVSALENEIDPCLYCCRLEYVTEMLNHISYSRIPKSVGLENALVENIAAGCTIVLNKSAANHLSGNFPSFAAVHDWWFYLYISYYGKIIYDATPLIKYRQHTANAIGKPRGLISKIYRVCVRFFGEKSFEWMSKQAISLKEIAARKDANVNSLLLCFVLGKSSIADRFRLIFSNRVARSNTFENFFLKVIIFLNIY